MITVGTTVNGRDRWEKLFYPGWKADSLLLSIEEGDIRWCSATVSEAPMRRQPRHSSEMLSQALMGHPLLVIDSQGEWLFAMGSDGYCGWINKGSVKMMDNDAMKRWRSSNRVVVSSVDQVRGYGDSIGSEAMTVLVDGNILEAQDSVGAQSGRVRVLLPDGRMVWVDSGSLSELAAWASQCLDGAKVTDFARAMTGVPYLWGANTTKEADCSGLVKAAYLHCGHIVPRDAWQQALLGTHVSADMYAGLQVGDLLFFDNGSGNGRISHVGIVDGAGRIVHASGRVRDESLNPCDEDYIGREILFGVSLKDAAGTPGLISVILHPWYFSE